ncbi:hypothetical protein [Pseudanabaena sp. ABRG5-3]|nr:hypothetical protein [Pseudanabaena sp. ABRG5-3]
MVNKFAIAQSEHGLAERNALITIIKNVRYINAGYKIGDRTI